MNLPLKKGKYSMVEDESIQSCSTYLQQHKNLKQCEYVSNRTRLRCQNVKSIDELKDYGFCNEHQGYIERIRKEGLRTKHAFDPNVTIGEGFDDDETLDSRSTTDFPFIYEPLYCESRLDGDENPLRNAHFLNKKEILEEYLKSIKRCQAALLEQRIIYREKHSKILRQGKYIAEQPNSIQIDPTKNVEKVQRFNVMRRDAFRLDKRQVFKEKFAKADTELTEHCAEQRNKWLKQIQVPIDENERVVSQLVAELVDLIVLTKSKRGPKTLLTAPAMHSIAKQNFKNKNDKNIFLPQTVVDILKGLKNAHFEEDLRKIREEEELERARMTRKIAIKMAPTILNPTNNFASRGSSICSDGPAPSTPSKPILPTIGTAMNFRTLNKNNNTLIYSTNKTINEGTVQRGALKRRCDTQTTGYFLTNNLIYSQQIKAKTTATTNNSNNNNNADPHGYLPSKLNFSENSYLLPSTSSTSLTTSALNGAANTFNNLKNLNRIIRPISIDEDINPDVFLQLTHPKLSETKKKKTSIEEEETEDEEEIGEEDEEGINTFVCARINNPWNGKRNAPTKKQKNINVKNKSLETITTTNNNNNNNGYVQYVANVLSRYSTTL